MSEYTGGTDTGSWVDYPYTITPARTYWPNSVIEYITTPKTLSDFTTSEIIAELRRRKKDSKELDKAILPDE